jgi:hypothetical protein
MVNKNTVFGAAVVALFFFAALRLVNRDFSYDELFTLSNFAFCPVQDVFSRYVNLNNHPLLSLVVNLWFRLAGVLDIHAVIQNPWVIRLPLLAASLGTLAFLCRFYGWTSAALLATTVPFYYYSVTVRGYGLSMLLASVLFYSAWSKKNLLAAVSAALLVYTVPSNTAYAIGVVSVCLAEYFFWRKRESLRSAVYVSVGVVWAALAYLPVVGHMMADPQVQSHSCRMRTLTESFPEAFSAFVSYRWLLLPAAAYLIAVKRTRVFWRVSRRKRYR